MLFKLKNDCIRSQCYSFRPSLAFVSKNLIEFDRDRTKECEIVGAQSISHAMVLDTYDQNQDLLIFKNTYDDESGGQPKKFTISRTHPNAPEEFYFVHIEIKDMDNLPARELIDTSDLY